MDLYTENRYRIKSGDCLLYRTKGAISHLVRYFSHANVNHAELVIRPYQLGCFHDRRFALGALGQGITLRLVSEKLRYHNGSAWVYPLKEKYDEYRDIIVSKAIDQEGAGYDYQSLFRQIVGKVSVDASKFFCSEFVYWAYRESGMPIPTLGHAPTPGDLARLNIYDTPIMIQ